MKSSNQNVNVQLMPNPTKAILYQAIQIKKIFHNVRNLIWNQ